MEFSYRRGDDDGPERWGHIRRDWAACSFGFGRRQSPIRLSAAAAIAAGGRGGYDRRRLPRQPRPRHHDQNFKILVTSNTIDLTDKVNPAQEKNTAVEEDYEKVYRCNGIANIYRSGTFNTKYDTPYRYDDISMIRAARVAAAGGAPLREVVHDGDTGRQSNTNSSKTACQIFMFIA
uniref:Uncharacterized protein n=1 Tax=Oryza glaberrima TaxID=4538 RepID=C0JA25_ORYGL|nr:unknown [Oryza glaberrima]